MQLKIDKLIYGGDGLSRLPADERGPGKTAFVPFVLDGELIEGELFEQKPGFARGRLERVLKPSAQRIEPACPYFQRCGGCHYQHSSYAHQLEIKAAILRETLKRTAKLDLSCELAVHAAREWKYRNRTRLKVQSAPQFALGYYKFRSHEFLAIEECPISSPLINQAIAATSKAGKAGEISGRLREIEFFTDHTDRSLLIEAYCDRGLAASEAEQIAEQVHGILPEIQGVAIFEQPEPNQFAEPKRLAAVGETAISYQTTGGLHRVSARAFFQVNRFLLDELQNIVCGGAAGKCVLDLYAGVGFFSAVLARNFAQVIAVEASQTSHADLRHNCGREVKAVLATTEQYLQQVAGIQPDLVVADPPRSGLGENVVRSLAQLGVPRITYVSCDPSTLARDLRTLMGLGFQVEGAHLVDLFPQTYHIESVFQLAANSKHG